MRVAQLRFCRESRATDVQIQTSNAIWSSGGRVVSSTFAIAAAMPLVATADEKAAEALEEIVVTAQKRSESLQDVPPSIARSSGVSAITWFAS